MSTQYIRTSLTYTYSFGGLDSFNVIYVLHFSVKSKQSSQAADRGLAVKDWVDLLRNRQEVVVKEGGQDLLHLPHWKLGQYLSRVIKIVITDI